MSEEETRGAQITVARLARRRGAQKALETGFGDYVDAVTAAAALCGVAAE
jgi:hypothetical protein